MDQTLHFLNRYACGLAYEALPESTLHAVTRHLIDTLGCAIGAWHMEPPRIARAHALECVSQPGATVLGTLHKTAPELAAFANGVMARYFDFNDTARLGSSGHPSDNILPVLAAAEYAGTGLRDAVAGIVVAYEVQNRLGAVCREVRANGWDHAVFVVVAAAAGAARAMRLTEEQTANAIALATVPNAAMGQTRVGQLSMWKGCTAPNAARNGVFAALLARRGMTGPQQAFEGTRGYRKQLGSSFELPAFGGADLAYAIEADKFKYYPCDYEAQCSITPAVELHKVLGDRLADIERIDVETYEHALYVAADTEDKWNPMCRETADHSIPYVVAVGLTRGLVWLDDFTEDRYRDPQILSLMQKIKVRATAGCTNEWPQAFPFHITATMKSGEKFERSVRYAKGHPENPMSDAELESKFRRLAEPIMERVNVDAALRRLWQLETLQSPRDVLEMFALN